MKFNCSFLLVCISVLGLAGCSGGGSSPASCVLGSGGTVTVSGAITFDRVPLDSSGALDFAATTVQPARHITVEAVCNSVLSTSITDSNGHYSLSVPAGTSGLLVRAKAEMLKTGSPGWDVKVLDEQQTVDLVFALDSSLLDVNTALTRNLHAPSGSDGTRYTSARTAAPFAILDTVYKSMQLIMQANPTAVFPPLKIKWSASSSDGSFYNEQTKSITLLGWLIDTDEFDEHVVAHEWGHYFQDAFSRDDSIGGPHSSGAILDIRVAFSEGFGNAFSAMVLDDPLYRDSQGLTAGFTIDVENNNCNIYSIEDVDGWYNECSVQSVLYDFYDVTGDSNDAFSLGFGEIHQVLVNDMPQSNAFTSLFSFINAFKLRNGNGSAVDSLLTAQSITSSISDDYGTGATAAGGSSIPLPPYLDGVDVFSGTQVCSTGVHGGYNGLGVSRYVRFTVPVTKRYTFKAVRQAGGLNPADPDMYIYHKGQVLAFGESVVDNSETVSVDLQADVEYVLELLEFGYANPSYDPAATGAINQTCFTVTQS